MNGRSYEVMRLFGFPIRIDPSWLIILLLVTWSLATGWFPSRHEGLSTATAWAMGLIGALALFASLVVHELSHSLMARRYDMPMEGITLFMFGGVAQMTDEPPSPKAEFWVAVAGPAASIAISILCWGLAVVSTQAGWPLAVRSVLVYLAVVNLVLVAFNAVPAFPLDGGRVFRSILWHWKGDLRWATRVASSAGRFFGVFLIVVGVLQLVAGNLIGGIWMAILGMFLRTAAASSYQQLQVRRLLEGEPVRRFMNQNVVSVSPQLTLEELVDRYVYEHHYKLFPVIDNGRPTGTVSTRRIKEVARDQWSTTRVADVLEPLTDGRTVRPDDDALAALKKMRTEETSRLLVLDGDRLVGILALKDLLELFELKAELEGD